MATALQPAIFRLPQANIRILETLYLQPYTLYHGANAVDHILLSKLICKI